MPRHGRGQQTAVLETVCGRTREERRGGSAPSAASCVILDASAPTAAGRRNGSLARGPPALASPAATLRGPLGRLRSRRRWRRWRRRRRRRRRRLLCSATSACVRVCCSISLEALGQHLHSSHPHQPRWPSMRAAQEHLFQRSLHIVDHLVLLRREDAPCLSSRLANCVWL